MYKIKESTNRLTHKATALATSFVVSLKCVGIEKYNHYIIYQNKEVNKNFIEIQLRYLTEYNLRAQNIVLMSLDLNSLKYQNYLSIMYTKESENQILMRVYILDLKDIN